MSIISSYNDLPSGISDDCFEHALISNIKLAKSDHNQDLFNRCMQNPEVYDEDGNFTPYSTVISTIEEHKALCSYKRTFIK